jgi:hypothetical protein
MLKKYVMEALITVLQTRTKMMVLHVMIKTLAQNQGIVFERWLSIDSFFSQYLQWWNMCWSR